MYDTLIYGQYMLLILSGQVCGPEIIFLTDSRKLVHAEMAFIAVYLLSGYCPSILEQAWSDIIKAYHLVYP